MVDTVDKETRSRIMARVRGKNTTPEIALRKALFARMRKRRQTGLHLECVYQRGSGCEHCGQRGLTHRELVTEILLQDDEFFSLFQREESGLAVRHWKTVPGGATFAEQVLKLVNQGRLYPFTAET